MLINKIKELFITYPFFYKVIRFPVIFLRYFLRLVHEDDFLYFKTLNLTGKGLFVDIGANSGQAALSFASINKSYDIISFEPNKFLEKELKMVKNILGKRFKYIMIGAGDENIENDFYVPIKKGVPMSEEGTFLYKKLFESETKQRIGEFNIIKQKFVLKRLDEYSLQPTIIKIDVEGYEDRAVKGIIETIKKYTPILIIEERINKNDVFSMLKPLGYEFFHFDKKSKTLESFKDNTSYLNYFCIPKDISEKQF